MSSKQLRRSGYRIWKLKEYKQAKSYFYCHRIKLIYNCNAWNDFCITKYLRTKCLSCLVSAQWRFAVITTKIIFSFSSKPVDCVSCESGCPTFQRLITKAFFEEVVALNRSSQNEHRDHLLSGKFFFILLVPLLRLLSRMQCSTKMPWSVMFFVDFKSLSPILFHFLKRLTESTFNIISADNILTKKRKFLICNGYR